MMRRMVGARKSLGFTLIEAVACLGVISIMFLGVSSIVANFLSLQKENESHSAMNRLAQIIRDRVGTESLCTAAIQPGNFPVNGAGNAMNVDLASSLPIALSYTGLGLGTPAKPSESLIQQNVILSDFNIRIDRVNLLGATLLGQFPNMDGITSPTNLYRASLVIQASAVLSPNKYVAMTPRWVTAIFVGVTNGQIRRCLNGLYGVVKACSDAGMVYAPYGYRKSAGDFRAPTDARGCVTSDAFVGDQGPTGGNGSNGSNGWNGAPGSNGSNGGPGWPGPPGPPGSPSDARVKTEIGSFDGGVSELQAFTGSEPREETRMNLIRAIQEQQRLLREMKKEADALSKADGARR